jgi:hypothetical protein
MAGHWRAIGAIEVDSGCLVIGDPTYLLPSAQAGKAGVDYQAVVDADWREAVTPFAGGLALLLQRFGGDGRFPVWGRFDGPELVSVRVDFVAPDE